MCPMKRATLTATNDAQAYHGFLIRSNFLNGLIWIEKESAFLGYATSVDDARRIIDDVLS